MNKYYCDFVFDGTEYTAYFGATTIQFGYEISLLHLRIKNKPIQIQLDSIPISDMGELEKIIFNNLQNWYLEKTIEANP